MYGSDDRFEASAVLLADVIGATYGGKFKNMEFGESSEILDATVLHFFGHGSKGMVQLGSPKEISKVVRSLPANIKYLFISTAAMLSIWQRKH